MIKQYEWYDKWDMDNDRFKLWDMDYGGFKLALMDKTSLVTRISASGRRDYNLYSITWEFYGLKVQDLALPNNAM